MALGAASRDLFAQMGELFEQDTPALASRPSLVPSQSQRSLSESITTQEMEGIMLGGTGAQADHREREQPQTLASPFTLSAPTFAPAASPGAPATVASPAVSTTSQAVAEAETPARIEAPKMDGSLPRFPTPQRPSPAASDSMPPPTQPAPVPAPTSSLSPPTSPAVDSPTSATPPQGRPRRKSFANMRFRSRSVSQHGAAAADSASPPASASALMGLGLASPESTSPEPGNVRPKLPSLSTKLSRVFQKTRATEQPDAIVPLPSSSSMPATSLAQLRPTSARPVPGADSSNSSRATIRTPSPLALSASEGNLLNYGSAARHVPSAESIIKHNVPTTVSASQFARPPPSVMPRSKANVAAIELDALDFVGTINLPSASSHLFGDDGPYAALRGVTRSVPGSPGSSSLPGSPREPRPQISIQFVVEPSVDAKQSESSGVAKRPKRSSSMFSLARPDSMMSVASSMDLLNPVAAGATLSPASAVNRRPLSAASAHQKALSNTQHADTAALDMRSLKKLRRLSSLSAIQDRLETQRLSLHDDDESNKRLSKAEALAPSATILRRRSSLSYLQAGDIHGATSSNGASYFPAVPGGSRTTEPIDLSSTLESESEDEVDLVHHSNASVSSSLAHFARALEAGFEESTDHGHSDEVCVMPTRPSTQTPDLASEEIKSTFNPQREALPLSASILPTSEQVEEPESSSMALAHLAIATVASSESDPSPPSPETEGSTSDRSDQAKRSHDVNLVPFPVTVSEIEVSDRPSFVPPADLAPSLCIDIDSAKMVPASEDPLVSPHNDSLNNSQSAKSNSSSISEVESPLFDRSGRESSESACPSEAGGSPKGQQRPSIVENADVEHGEGGLGRPWTTGKPWTHEISLDNDDERMSIGEDSSDEEQTNPINHFSVRLADELDADSEDENDGNAYSSSGIEDDESEIESVIDVSLREATCHTLHADHDSQIQQARLIKRSSKTLAARNPFNFEPNKMQKRDRRGNLQPLEESEAPPRAPSPPSPFVGHSLLPQTDEIVQLRAKKSLTRLRSSPSSPDLSATDVSSELPAFVQNSALSMADPVQDAAPLAAISRKASISKALASLTKRAPPQRPPPSLPVDHPSSASEMFTTAAQIPPPPSQPLPSTPSTSTFKPAAPLLRAPKPIRPMGAPLRIYFADKERYTVVELVDDLTVRGVLQQIHRNGDMVSDNANLADVGWALFESWRDFGIERPIREYENIPSIIRSWPSQGADNRLVLKRTKKSFVRLASARRQPQKRDKPIKHFVRLETKRGKWDKRWLVLDDVAVSSLKSEKSKDRIPLCNMSNWDVYLVPAEYTTHLRPPYPYTFALKCTKGLEAFTDIDDAIWYLSCKTGEEAETWYGWLYDSRSLYLLNSLPAPTPSPITRPPPSGGRSVLLASTPPSHGAESRPFAAAGHAISRPSIEAPIYADGSRMSRLNVKSLLDLSGFEETHVLPRPPAPTFVRSVR